MKDFQLDLQAALEWLKTHCAQTVSRFLKNLNNVPSWGSEVDDKVQIYIDGLGQWVRGNDDWSYEGKRYYGEEGLSITATRVLALRGGREVANYLQQVDSCKSRATALAPHDDPGVRGKCENALLSFPKFHLPWMALLGAFMYWRRSVT